MRPKPKQRVLDQVQHHNWISSRTGLNLCNNNPVSIVAALPFARLTLGPLTCRPYQIKILSLKSQVWIHNKARLERVVGDQDVAEPRGRNYCHN